MNYLERFLCLLSYTYIFHGSIRRFPNGYSQENNIIPWKFQGLSISSFLKFLPLKKPFKSNLAII